MKISFAKGKREVAWLLVFAVIGQSAVFHGTGSDGIRLVNAAEKKGNVTREYSKTWSEPVIEVKENDCQKEGTDVSEVDWNTEILFADGDSEQSVTRNVSFVNCAPEQMKTRWVSSDKSVITDKGKVTRQKKDKKVTITANVRYKGKNYRKKFSLVVKRKNTIDVNSLEDYSLDQIDQMNKEDEYYSVDMNEFGYVCDIYGTYSDVKVDSWDTALMSLYNVKSLLGIGDVFGELQVRQAYTDEYGYIFKFDQIYKGVCVIDSGVTVSSDRNGKVDFLGSGYLPITNDIDIQPALTMEEAAESAAQAGYGKPEDDEMLNEDYLLVYNEAGKGRLVWMLYCLNEQTYEYYQLLVDAKTGEIIYANEITGCF